jgi:hypothetical protein
MIYSTATVPVNPQGETRLTREQVWNGLELKARDARLFLPPGLCTRCDVTEESACDLRSLPYGFSTTPTADARYDWLNRVMAVGTGNRVAGGPTYSIHEIA